MALYTLGRSFWSPINIQNKVFSQAVCPIELKFHVKTPYGKFAIYYTQLLVKHDLGDRNVYIFLSRTRRLMTLGLGI